MGNKRTFILWGMVYLAVTFMAVLIYTEKEKEYRKETSRNAFWNAVRQEKETGIREVVFRYRQDNPPNDLSEEEKRNWCDQAFLLTEDPDRVRPDHSIKQLKDLVSALGIGIHLVREKGYQMSFPVPGDAPKAVRPPEAEGL